MLREISLPDRSVGTRPMLLLWRKILIGLSLVLALILIPTAAAAGWAFYLQRTGNFHVIEPGSVYRSNTLGKEQLAQVVKQYGIKSVLNLRGDSGQNWYRDQSRTLAGLGVVQIDIELSDTKIPAPALMAKLIEALRTAPRPLLIHCRAGADRTGLAAALYEYIVAGKSADSAAGQLSFIYGHFPWYPSATSAMDAAFWQVVHAAP